MTISLQDDSDGNTFQIWAQRQANSCSVASIWMARGIARQMTFAEEEWDLAHRMYHSAVAGMTWENGPPPASAPRTMDEHAHSADQNSMANTFATNGTFAHQVAAMLRTEGFTVSHSGNSGTAQQINTANLGPTKPAIVLVGWYGSGSRAGGHFIVAARRNSSAQIVYLDPWGGVLREVPNNARYPGGGLVEEVVYITG